MSIINEDSSYTLIRICIFGSDCAGKSSIINRYDNDLFTSEYVRCHPFDFVSFYKEK